MIVRDIMKEITLWGNTVDKRSREEKGIRETMINREIGIEFCAGSEEVYQEVLMTYLEEGPDYLQKMVTYKEQRDWKNYSVIVHSIKSNAKTIGAQELAEVALEQEMAAKSGDEATIDAKWKITYETYAAVLEEVKGMVQ